MLARGTAALSQSAFGLALAKPPVVPPLRSHQATEPSLWRHQRQAAWRARQIAAGRCARCGERRNKWKTVCDACHLRAGGKVPGAPIRRLSADDVRAIRARRAAGETLQALALAFNTSVPQVSRVVGGRSWKQVT